jgi:zinc D-Ala-D-Ala carboxypeptidase
MNLSANFTLKELTKSETATRLDIDNTPNQEQIESLRLLCENILATCQRSLWQACEDHIWV